MEAKSKPIGVPHDMVLAAWINWCSYYGLDSRIGPANDFWGALSVPIRRVRGRDGEWFVYSDDTRRLIEMLAGPHYHAILKAMEARQPSVTA